MTQTFDRRTFLRGATFVAGAAGAVTGKGQADAAEPIMPEVAREINPLVIAVLRDRARLAIPIKDPAALSAFVRTIPELRGDPALWRDVWESASSGGDQMLWPLVIKASLGNAGPNKEYTSESSSARCVTLTKGGAAFEFAYNSAAAIFELRFMTPYYASGAAVTLQGASELRDMIEQFASISPKAACGIRAYACGEKNLVPFGTVIEFVDEMGEYCRQRATHEIAALIASAEALRVKYLA